MAAFCGIRTTALLCAVRGASNQLIMSTRILFYPPWSNKKRPKKGRLVVLGWIMGFEPTTF